MKKAYLPLILIVFVILEGLAINLLPERFLSGNYLIIAHWALAFLVFIAVYYDLEDTYYSILYGFIFGLLIDIVYTGILGIYMFSYGVTMYAIHALQRVFQQNFHVLVLSGALAFLLGDLLIYIMYSVISVTDMGWKEYLLERSIPTLLANLLFLLVLFPIFKSRLVRWSEEQLENNS